MNAIRTLWRWLRAWLLRYQIWETEHYLRDCEREGITSSLNMREFRLQLAGLRVQLADLQAPSDAAARGKGFRKPQHDANQSDTAGAHGGAGPNELRA